MTDRDPERRYDDEEVTAILRRATELGRDDPRRLGASTGTSLQELEDIAREAGIPADLIRRAAREVDAGASSGGTLRGWERFYGNRTLVVREVEVDGEVSEEAMADLVTLIERTTDQRGHASVLGRSLTWRSETTSGDSRKREVVVTPRDGRTTIRVEEDLRQVAGGTFGGSIGGFGGGFGFGVGAPIGAATGSVLTALGLPIAVVGLTFLGARAFYGSLVSRRDREVAELAHRLEEEVRRHTSSDTPSISRSTSSTVV